MLRFSKTLRSMSSHSSGEEALGHRIIEAVADRPHGALHTGGPTGPGEVIARVLTALIGVMDDDAVGLLAGDGHLERPRHQLGVLVGRHRPAHHLAGIDVEDHGQEQEAGPRRHVGDVGHPAMVGPRSREVALEEVRCGPGPVVSPGRAAELAPGHALEVRFLHEASDAVAPRLLAVLVDQLGSDAPIAIGAPRLGVHQVDLLCEHLVGEVPGRGWACEPAVVARSRHAEALAHGRGGEDGLIRRDELEGPYGVECVSCANQAAAFFRISFSCSSFLTRRRKAASSARSSVVSPSLRTPSSRSAWATQLRTVWSEQPATFAASMKLSPPHGRAGRPPRGPRPSMAVGPSPWWTPFCQTDMLPSRIKVSADPGSLHVPTSRRIVAAPRRCPRRSRSPHQLV